MNTTNTMPLDILVHLTNGHTARFRQEDAEAARQLLNPANILRILAHPVPPEMTPGVWPAEYVSVNPAESGLSLSAH